MLESMILIHTKLLYYLILMAQSLGVFKIKWRATRKKLWLSFTCTKFLHVWHNWQKCHCILNAGLSSHNHPIPTITIRSRREERVSEALKVFYEKDWLTMEFFPLPGRVDFFVVYTFLSSLLQMISPANINIKSKQPFKHKYRLLPTSWMLVFIAWANLLHC